MKKIFIILAIGFSTLYYSQAFTPERIKEDNLSKEQNYSNALSWASLNSKELKSKTIITSDSNIGMVSMSVIATLMDDISVYYNIEFNLKIEVKDKKYKVSYLTPIITVKIKQDSLDGLSVKQLNSMKKNIETVISLCKKKFDDKLEWNYEEVNKAKNDYSLSIDEINIIVNLLNKLEELQKNTDQSIDKTMSNNNDW